MKRSFILILILMAAGMGLFSTGSDTERWDLRMIKQAPIWKNLMVNYAYADHKKFWPERKKALETILDKYPDSRWTDDAALILACGKASFENDTNGAVAALKKVAETYPNGRTIVVDWSPGNGCRFDDKWVVWQGGLVFLNPDGSIRTAKPFHRHGEISDLEKETLAYFKHLDQFPRSTTVTAQLFISRMLGLKGDTAGAVSVLEKIVSHSAGYLPGINKADRRAASQPHGYHTRNLITRPEYRAYLSLIGYYEKRKQVDKAAAAAGKLLNFCSKDGWLWTLNKTIGNFYERHHMPKQAEEQFQLALDGLMNYKDDVEKRNQLVKGSDIPDQFWKDQRKTLETKLKSIKKPGKKN
jgi:hypothetical protein